MTTAEAVDETWQRMRDTKPLVHCITNYVSMDLMANTLLAVGASPAMVVALEEVEAFAKIADVLLINVGTLTPVSKAAMLAAAAAYNALNKPWVLDPVAAGATPFRTQAITELLQYSPALIRGNASEVMAVAGAAGAGGRGTDSTVGSEAALEAAKQLAVAQSCIVAVSGATDLVTDGRRVIRVSNGRAQMQTITATGCTLPAVMAAFLAARAPDAALAAAHAMSIYGCAMVDWLAAGWKDAAALQARQKVAEDAI